MNQRAEDAFRADIVEVGRRMYARGYVASNDGNISIRLDDSTILTTPKSVSKGFMTPDMMVVVDLDGKKIRGTRDASSELLMHLEVYQNRPDVRAVVHAHPPTATGFAVAGIPLDRAVLAEVVTTLGSIPIAEYGTPSTPELPAAVRKYIKAHDGLLLANHGALTVGAATCTRRTTRWRRSSTSRRSASWRGSSAASICCRAKRCTDCRNCAATTASRRRRRFAPTDRRRRPNADPASCQIVRGVRHLAERGSIPTRSGGFGRGNSAIIPRAYGPH